MADLLSAHHFPALSPYPSNDPLFWMNTKTEHPWLSRVEDSQKFTISRSKCLLIIILNSPRLDSSTRWNMFPASIMSIHLRIHHILMKGHDLKPSLCCLAMDAAWSAVSRASFDFSYYLKHIAHWFLKLKAVLICIVSQHPMHMTWTWLILAANNIVSYKQIYDSAAYLVYKIGSIIQNSQL